MPDSPASTKPPVVCAWCNKLLKDGNPALMTSHGICPNCMGGMLDVVVEDLGSADAAVLEDLPLGVVRLNAEGIILAYTQRESKRFGNQPSEVIGRSFFEDIAPCSSVKEFRGRFEDLVRGKTTGRAELDFLFCYEDNQQMVHIVLTWDENSAVGHLLISTSNS